MTSARAARRSIDRQPHSLCVGVVDFNLAVDHNLFHHIDVENHLASVVIHHTDVVNLCLVVEVQLVGEVNTTLAVKGNIDFAVLAKVAVLDRVKEHGNRIGRHR